MDIFSLAWIHFGVDNALLQWPQLGNRLTTRDFRLQYKYEYVTGS